MMSGHLLQKRMTDIIAGSWSTFLTFNSFK